jgi:lipopolysaccharide export system permease protein
MKKLIFQKFAKDTLNFFMIMCLAIGIIVWTLQAVNYFDFVTKDGHGLKTYFAYILFNFPKIIHRIIPFIFFITLFYMIINYETRNELSIFWINGVSKVEFANKVIFLSIILTIFQVIMGSFFSPYTQFKGREFLKNSNIDFFTSLIKEGKFINAVDGLTIFIERKNKDGTYSNIFLDDSSKTTSKMIYAKNGILIDDKQRKFFRLFEGKVINNEKPKINVFEFQQIDFNLTDYSSNTILVPKVQEVPSGQLLECSLEIYLKIFKERVNFRCEEKIKNEINQELLKRFYKPLFIPIIAILCCYLLIVSKNNVKYKKNIKIVILFTLFFLILSEATLRYSTISKIATIIYLLAPWICFVFVYFIFLMRSKNV